MLIAFLKYRPRISQGARDQAKWVASQDLTGCENSSKMGTPILKESNGVPSFMSREFKETADNLSGAKKVHSQRRRRPWTTTCHRSSDGNSGASTLISTWKWTCCDGVAGQRLGTSTALRLWYFQSLGHADGVVYGLFCSLFLLCFLVANAFFPNLV